MDRLRAGTSSAEPPDVAAPTAEEPESIIESLALRDWVWTAVGRLSEPLRLVVMLRHFSQCSAYEDIAAVCDVPVGTVRSRLNEARRMLADDLLRTAAHAHSEAARRTAAERNRLHAAVDHSNRTQTHDALLATMADDMVFRMPDGTRHDGLETIRAGLYSDIEAGVRLHFLDAFASPGITIMEAKFVNPPEDPEHCPPAISWVQWHRDRRTHTVAVHYAPRPAR